MHPNMDTTIWKIVAWKNTKIIITLAIAVIILEIESIIGERSPGITTMKILWLLLRERMSPERATAIAIKKILVSMMIREDNQKIMKNKKN